ncbi:hypothetical protein STENM327S_00046 [Streptomyces tendae]
MLWVLISTVLTMTAYKLWQHDQRGRAGRSAAGRPVPSTPSAPKGGESR